MNVEESDHRTRLIEYNGQFNMKKKEKYYIKQQIEYTRCS